jgi:hypothetical protein
LVEEQSTLVASSATADHFNRPFKQDVRLVPMRVHGVVRHDAFLLE